MRKFIVYTLSAILATTTIVAGIVTKMLSREEEKKPTRLHEKIFKRFKKSQAGRTKHVAEKKEVKKTKPVGSKAVKKAKPMAKKTKVR